jgi:hypothetical protein
MPEFHLVHIALVGARMPAFKEYGFHDRNQLAMLRVAPQTGGQSLNRIPRDQLHATLQAQLPLWIHNMIADPDFPGRHELLMPLRRFEGELYDSKNDDVVAAVLSAGFKNQALDPLNLPSVMPLRKRCAIVMQVAVWQEAYRQLEEDVLEILSNHREEITRWLDLFGDCQYSSIEEKQRA